MKKEVAPGGDRRAQEEVARVEFNGTGAGQLVRVPCCTGDVATDLRHLVELVLDVVDLVLGPILGVVELVLRCAGGLVGFAFAPQVIVVRQGASRFLRPALGSSA